MSATLTFLGAAGAVTGSKYLLTVGERRILVDSGMFQGEKDLRLRNWAEFPVPPDTITDVLLTHAHLDHCGYLPVLVRGGFSGPIWCTAPTAKLAEIVLRDAAFLQERDALDAAEGGWSKHNPPKPLYDSSDVAKTLPLLTEVEFDRDLDLGDGIYATYVRAGHILGSASIRVQTPETSVVFSGDIGRADHPVLRSRETPAGADYVLVESTYGDREHPEPRNLPHEHFADVIRRTIDRGGSVLVPAFAVDRTEVVLKTLADMRRHGRIPKTPIAVNSPMALAALAVYRAYPDELRADLDLDDLMGDIREIHTAEESREFTQSRQTPGIVISSSGMATGGRVLHHLERMLPDERNAVVLTGYQAVGTRGRSLVEGATRLKMHGRYVGVRAEILQDHEFSVHADSSDVLDWLRGLKPAPMTVFCVHGEPQASEALEARIEGELGIDAVVPRMDEVVALTPAQAAPASKPARYRPARQGGATVTDMRPVAASPGATHAAIPAAGGLQVALSDDVAAGLGVGELESVSVTGDLTPRREDEHTIVLEGTLTIRLKH